MADPVRIATQKPHQILIGPRVSDPLGARSPIKIWCGFSGRYFNMGMPTRKGFSGSGCSRRVAASERRADPYQTGDGQPPAIVLHNLGRSTFDRLRPTPVQLLNQLIDCILDFRSCASWCCCQIPNPYSKVGNKESAPNVKSKTGSCIWVV